MSRAVGEGGGARGGDDFVHGGACGVPVADDGASAGDGVPVVDGSDSTEGAHFVEAIPVVEGGPLSRPRAVSREFIEAELERWSGLLERLGN